MTGVYRLPDVPAMQMNEPEAFSLRSIGYAAAFLGGI
jgi:hypothetical protein